MKTILLVEGKKEEKSIIQILAFSGGVYSLLCEWQGDTKSFECLFDLIVIMSRLYDTSSVTNCLVGDCLKMLYVAKGG